MDRVMSAGIGVIRKIKMLDLEFDSELAPEEFQPGLGLPKSIDSAVRNVSNYAIFAILQCVFQRAKASTSSEL
jgi:hypothetical protein